MQMLGPWRLCALGALLFALWLAPADNAGAQERHLHTYTLRRALPEQVIPAISAQLAPGSSVTPYRQQLIMNVTDAEFRDLQSLLAQLDIAPRSLLISVRKQGQQFDQDTRYGVQGSVGSGNVQVRSGDGWQRREETRVYVNQGSSRGSSDGSQQVRAVEGMDAFIGAGTTLSTRNAYGGNELTPVESGFYANARVIDGEVIVDVDQRDDRVQGRNMATQGLQTQVRGRLGEWIPLGGIDNSRSDSQRGLSGYGSGSSSSLSDLMIKVDLVE